MCRNSSAMYPYIILCSEMQEWGKIVIVFESHAVPILSPFDKWKE